MTLTWTHGVAFAVGAILAGIVMLKANQSLQVKYGQLEVLVGNLAQYTYAPVPDGAGD